MPKASIREIAEALAAQTAAHWKSCLESGLEDHSPKAHAAVDQCLAQYFSELEANPEPQSEEAIIATIQSLFARLDEVSATFGPGLLETDERELFVTAIIDAAKVAGLDPDKFEHGDPTFAFRNF